MKRTTLKHLGQKELDKDKIVLLSPGHAPSMVTTIGPSGNVNVATFEQTMIVSYKPARIMLAISPNSDTYKNIHDGSDCVVGFPRPEFVQAAYDCGVKLPRDVSELGVVTGLSVRQSMVVKPPQIEQCWVNMECQLVRTIPAGDHYLVLLDILHVTLDADVWNDDKVARRNNLPAVYYTTAGHFFVPGKKSKVGLSSNLDGYKNGD